MYQDIFPNELNTWTQKGAVLIDVRETFEYDEGHIPNTTNIPLGSLAAKLQDIPDNVVLICAAGGRSAQAAQYLSEQGYKQVANLMGGTFGWQSQGLALEETNA